MKQTFKKICVLLMAVMFVIVGAIGAVSAMAEGDEQTSADAAPSIPMADIFLVLDTSSQMNWNGGFNGNHMSRMKEAAKDFVAVALAYNTAGLADIQIGIITFGGGAKTYDMTKDQATLNAIIDGLSAGGDSYMYDGLNAVKTLDEAQGREGAQKQVCVMAGSFPNAGPTKDSGKYSASDSLLYYKYGNAVYELAESMWPTYYIYTVAFTPCDSTTNLFYKFIPTLLDDIENSQFFAEYDSNGIKALIERLLQLGPKPAPETTTRTPDPTTESTTPAPATTTEPVSVTPLPPCGNPNCKCPHCTCKNCKCEAGKCCTCPCCCGGVIVVPECPVTCRPPVCTQKQCTTVKTGESNTAKTVAVSAAVAVMAIFGGTVAVKAKKDD